MKRNNSLLLTILGGAIFCFVFLGMAFLSTKNTNNMKGNNQSSNEISLGDVQYRWVSKAADPAVCTQPSGCAASVSGLGTATYAGQTGCVYSTTTSNCPSACSSSCYVKTHYMVEEYNSNPNCSAGQYWNGSSCQSCPSSYPHSNKNAAGNQPLSSCYLTTSPGKHVPVATQGQTECIKGSWSAGGETVYYNATNSCTKCMQGYTTKDYGATSEEQCSEEANYGVMCTYPDSLRVGETIYGVCAFDSGTIVGSSSVTAEDPSIVSVSKYGGTTDYNFTMVFKGISPGCTQVRLEFHDTVGVEGSTTDLVCVTCPDDKPYWDEETKECYPDPSPASIDCENVIYSSEMGKYICTKCNDEVLFVNNGMCDLCYAGNWCDGISQHPCDEGYYQDEHGATSCKLCNGVVSEDRRSCETTEPCASIPTSTQCLERSDCEWDYTNLCHDKSSGSTGACTITATNVSGYQHMSPGESVSVRFNVSGNCTGDVKTSLTHFTGPSTVSQNTTGSFTASPSCHNGTIKGCVKSLDDNKDVCSQVGIYIATTWNGPREVTISSGSATPTSAAAANQAGKDYYYTSCTSASSNQVTCQKYTRGCNSGGGGSQTIPKCYQDENEVYHWTSSPEASWVVVSKSEPECNNNDACFEKPDGTRIWGKYYAQIAEGYRLITTIGDRDVCEHPSEDEACYVKDGDYKWSATEVEGYTKVEGLDDKTCQPELCYINIETGIYDFGKHDGDGKYAKVYDEENEVIKEAGKCKAPDEEACYEGPNGYEWGAFAEDTDYTLVPEITEMSQCVNGKGDVPVPATGISISKIIYIFMAILMACGVGFIYYSSIVKKTEE